METVAHHRTIGGCTLRPIDSADRQLLAEIYASTRRDELAKVDWPQEQKEVFLYQQFGFQHDYYQQHFTKADFDILLMDSEAIGRLYVERREDAISIIDIALLPQHRGRGTGTAILKELCGEAASREQGRAVVIHVEKMNPAMSLYQRLGFRKVADHEVYDLMEWSPEE